MDKKQDKPRVDQIDQLYDAVREYRSSDAFRKMMQTVSNFPRLSPYNAMLVAMQKPGSYYVARIKVWRGFHRRPKPEARPLVILRNFGPIDFVYEYNDTEGEEIPEDVLSSVLLHPFRTNQVVSEPMIERLIREMRYDGLEYEEKDYGQDLAAKIRTTRGKMRLLPSQETSRYVNRCATIYANKNLGTTEKFASILHELGHFYCGHLGRFGVKFIPERYSPTLETKEFEAETVAWLCCERMGIKNPSVEYLSGYTQGGEIPPVMISAILKAAGSIEKLLQGKATVRNELRVKRE